MDVWKDPKEREHRADAARLPEACAAASEISAVCYFKRCDKCGHFYQTVGEAGHAVTHSLLPLPLRTVKGARIWTVEDNVEPHKPDFNVFTRHLCC